MALILEPKEGDTLLSPDELELIIPVHITNREQLDEAEQANIEDAMQWVFLSGPIEIDWSGGGLVNESEARKNYINAMKLADRNDYSLLLKCIGNESKYLKS